MAMPRKRKKDFHPLLRSRGRRSPVRYPDRITVRRRIRKSPLVL